MASHRVEETGLSSHQLLYRVNNNPSSILINHDGPSFEFGELEQAFVLQEQGAKNKLHSHQTKQSFLSGRGAAATLEMFPSWPIQFQQTPRGVGLGGRDECVKKSSYRSIKKLVDELELELEEECSMSKKGCNSSSSSSSVHDQCCFVIQKHLQQIQGYDMMLTDVSTSTTALSPQQQHHHSPQLQKRKGCDSISTSQTQQLDAKTLRRLAQNREAARKSRLRKKAYVQQLESSRIKLTQLEHDLQWTRSQGLFVGCSGAGGGMVSSGAMFDMEYGRWLEEEERKRAELRGAVEGSVADGELRVMVDACICHYDQIFRLKGEAANSDVFHLITGIWMSPAERCFLWIGGFRPSDLIKMLMSQLEPVTEQQVIEIYKLQHSSQQAEDALSQGLDQLYHSLTQIIAGAPLIGGINHMLLAMDNLSNLQGFLHQADTLRQQILHQLYRILTIRQAGRCLVAIGEYYSRLRALSSIWSSRPKE